MANDKDVKRAWLGVDLGGTKILAGVFDDGLSRLARSKTDDKASGGVGSDNVPGSLESIASRSALTRQIQREVKNGRSTLLTEIVGPDLKKIKSGQLRKAIERGDTFVESLICRAAEHVGAAIGTLINIINPEVIVLGGGLMEQLEKRILPIIRAKALECSDSGVNRGIRIVASSLADDAGIVGAAAFARRSSKG
jgi:glucokinase